MGSLTYSVYSKVCLVVDLRNQSLAVVDNLHSHRTLWPSKSHSHLSKDIGFLLSYTDGSGWQTLWYVDSIAIHNGSYYALQRNLRNWSQWILLKTQNGLHTSFIVH